MSILVLGLLACCAAGGSAPRADSPIVGLTDEEFVSAIRPWASSLPPIRFGFRAGGRSSYAGDPEARNEAGPLGSVSKPVFATLALRLKAQKKLAFNSKLSLFGLKVPGDESVTIGELLNHTSGYPECMYGFNPRLACDQEQLMTLIRTAARRRSNAGRFLYSNTNYALLGMACQAASGKTADQMIGAEVNAPIGVSFRTARLPEFDLNWYGGSGCLVGTVEDVAKFGEAIAADRGDWLTPDDRRLMLASTAPMGNGSEYGLGVIVAHLAVVPSASHGGEIPASLPYSCFVAATLAPMEPAGFAAEFRGDVMDQKILNYIYGAYASACALLECKRWLAKTAGAQAISDTNRASAEALATLSAPRVRRIVHQLGPNPVLTVTSEIVRMDHVEMEVAAKGENGSISIACRFGMDMKLDSFSLSS